MSAHLRLLSAAASLPALLPTPTPAPASLRRLTPASPLTIRSRLLSYSPEPRLPHAVRGRRAAAAVAGAGGGEQEDSDEAIASAGIWGQVRDIVVFAGPALGLWICGPLMSLIDTMVIGQISFLQLAALGGCLVPTLSALCSCLYVPWAYDIVN